MIKCPCSCLTTQAALLTRPEELALPDLVLSGHAAVTDYFCAMQATHMVAGGVPILILTAVQTSASGCRWMLRQMQSTTAAVSVDGYCGSGFVWGELAGKGSIVGYPTSALDLNTTISTTKPLMATAG